MENTRNKKTITLAQCAIALGLSIALSYVKVINMPFGGSVTLLSMLPIAFISIKHGIKWGIATSSIFAVIQLLTSIGEIFTWSLTPIIFVGAVLLDYILAFTPLGLAGLFRKKGYEGQCLGVVFAVTLRFVSHFISGIVLWSSYKEYYEWADGLSVPVYSLIYNGIYMFPEILFTGMAAAILLKLPQVRKLLTA